jgi:hypothetical protein
MQNFVEISSVVENKCTHPGAVSLRKFANSCEETIDCFIIYLVSNNKEKHHELNHCTRF